MFDGHFCLVFELLHAQSMISCLSGVRSESQKLNSVRKITLRLLSALGFLQRHNVIHADVKPDNLILQTRSVVDSVKLIDFGNALHCTDEEMSLYYTDFELQTLIYRAPEVMFGAKFGCEIDMWSLGCVVAELFMGQPLFYGGNKKQILGKVTSLLGPIPLQLFEHGKYFSELREFCMAPAQPAVVRIKDRLKCSDYNFADFISRLLQFDPDERMTVEEASQHEFIAAEIPIRYLLPLSNDYREVTMTSNVHEYYVRNQSDRELVKASLEQQHGHAASSDRFPTKSASIGRRARKSRSSSMNVVQYTEIACFPMENTRVPPSISEVSDACSEPSSCYQDCLCNNNVDNWHFDGHSAATSSCCDCRAHDTGYDTFHHSSTISCTLSTERSKKLRKSSVVSSELSQSRCNRQLRSRENRTRPYNLTPKRGRGKRRKSSSAHEIFKAADDVLCDDSITGHNAEDFSRLNSSRRESVDSAVISGISSHSRNVDRSPISANEAPNRSSIWNMTFDDATEFIAPPYIINDSSCIMDDESSSSCDDDTVSIHSGPSHRAPTVVEDVVSTDDASNEEVLLLNCND